MAITTTKTALTFLASTANGAGSTTTGSGIDLTLADGAIVTGSYTNGGTGPTIGVTQTVQTSNDNTNWDTYATETAPTTNSATGNFQPVYIGPEVMYARVSYTGNTGQSVTVSARGSKVVFT